MPQAETVGFHRMGRDGVPNSEFSKNWYGRVFVTLGRQSPRSPAL